MNELYVGVCVADSQEADAAGVSRGCETSGQVLVCFLFGSPPLYRRR